MFYSFSFLHERIQLTTKLKMIRRSDTKIKKNVIKLMRDVSQIAEMCVLSYPVGGWLVGGCRSLIVLYYKTIVPFSFPCAM